MALTTEDLTSSLIRVVPQSSAVDELLMRGIYAGERFLDLTRATEQSTALTSQQKILEDHSIIGCFNKSLRSNLAALVAVRGKSIKKFTTIKIYLDQNDYIKVNTMGSKCIGNQYVYRIGAYGRRGSISVLQVLQKVLGGTDERTAQKILFTKLTDCVKKGVAISENDLLEINPKLQQLELTELALIRARLLALTYLIYYLEITRRPTYAGSAGSKTGAASQNKTILCCEVCFDAWTKVLELLKRGVLSINQVFAADAPYGLPTGKRLRSSSDHDLMKKYTEINALYMQTLFPVEYAAAQQNGQTLIPSMEETHLRLTKNSTFMSESPAKPYITPLYKRPNQEIDRTDSPRINLMKALEQEAHNVAEANVSSPSPLFFSTALSKTTKKRPAINDAEITSRISRKKR